MKALLIFTICITSLSAYGGTVPVPTPRPDQVEDERGSRSSVRTSGGFFLPDDYFKVEDEIFWKLSKKNADEVKNSRSTFSNFISGFAGQIRYGENLHTSRDYEKTEESGDYYFVSTNYNATVHSHEEDSDLDRFSSDTKAEKKTGDYKIKYEGSINSSQFFNNADSSLTLIKTSKFDPCTVDHESAARLKSDLNKLSAAQLSQQLYVNCMFGEKLNGKIVAFFAVTDQEGKLLTRVDLTGSLTLKLSEALSIKYQSKYLEGEDPFFNNTTNPNSNEQTGEFQQSFTPQGAIRIGDIYFFNKDLLVGKSNELSIKNQRKYQNLLSGEEDCSLTEELILKRENRTEEDVNIYNLNISTRCKETFFEVGLSNNYESSDEQATKISVKASKSESSDEHDKYIEARINVAHLEIQNSFAADFTVRGTIRENDGSSTSVSGRVIHNPDNTYAVITAEKETLIFSEKSLKRLQEDAKKNKKPLDLKSARVCSIGDCRAVKASLTVDKDGETFVAVRADTDFNFADQDFNFEATVGVPLTSNAENQGFGRKRFFGKNDEAFFQGVLRAKDCDVLKGCLSGFGRISENSKAGGIAFTKKF